MTSPSLLYSDVEDDLRSTVRDLLRDRLDPAAQLRALDSDAPHDRALWSALAARVGLAGLLVPEELGGADASAREAAVVLEELGRAVAAVPFLSSAVVATSALLEIRRRGPVPGQVDDALHRLAAGDAVGILAVPLTAAPGDAWPTSVTMDGSALRGAVTSVADGELADVVVVPAVRSGSPVLALAEFGVPARPRVSLDQSRRLSDLSFDGPGTVLAEGDAAVAALEAAVLAGAGLLASEQLGVAEWCLAETVAYLKVRRQFGRPLGSFQALKHRLADVWLEVTSLRAVARYAADRLAGAAARTADGGETAVAVSVAQAYAATTAVHAAEEALQLHGGIGMTWEHPVHLRLKRAKADQLALGTPGRHRARLSELVDLPPPLVTPYAPTP